MSNSAKSWVLNKQAQEFLVYMVFGITNWDKKEDILKKCIRTAYLDMNRTLCFKGNKKEKEKNAKDFYDRYSSLLFDVLKTCLKSGEVKEARKNAQNVFFKDNKGVEVKEELKEKLDHRKRNGDCFYFGQAQKWINMTLKYLWLLGIIKDEKELEVPIDSLILEGASRMGIKTLPRDNKMRTKGCYCSNTMPWSRFNRSEYDELQRAINDIVSNPMKWEHKTWIELSNEKRKNEQ